MMQCTKLRFEARFEVEEERPRAGVAKQVGRQAAVQSAKRVLGAQQRSKNSKATQRRRRYIAMD